MFEKLKRWFSLKPPAGLRERLEQMARQGPLPVFWLLGKTQSGKTSVIRFLTGAENAEIGQGFKPCTRFSRRYMFPSADAPVLEFLDTRGLEEPGYAADEDLKRFGDETHVLIVTVRVLDQSLATLLEHVREIRRGEPGRPLILLPTCLHEAYPQQQHVKPYPFEAIRPGQPIHWKEAVPDTLRRALDSVLERFEGLYDVAVPIDFTLPEEGFDDPYYGGQLLKQTLIESLPEAYRQTLLAVEENTGQLRDLYARQALPHVLTYTGLAAAAGALPMWMDLVAAPAVQTRMVTQLAKLYDQPLSAARFMELAGALGLGIAVQTAGRRLTKFVPFLRGAAGNALAWAAATFALGKACCYYFSAIRQGHLPDPEDVQHFYQRQLQSAEQSWRGAPAIP